MTELKALRNKVVTLKRSLNLASKDEKAKISEEIIQAEKELEEARKDNRQLPPVIMEQKKEPLKEFKPSKSSLKKKHREHISNSQREDAYKKLESSVNKLKADKEMADIERQLSEHSFSLFEIAPDGNCLFAALQHQLLIREQKQLSVRELRELAVRTIQENATRYEPFLEESLESYCQGILRPGEWGGELELLALSQALKIPIRIFQAFTEPLIIKPLEDFENSDLKRTLDISYHKYAYALGEHYNSIINNKAGNLI